MAREVEHGGADRTEQCGSNGALRMKTTRKTPARPGVEKRKTRRAGYTLSGRSCVPNERRKKYRNGLEGTEQLSFQHPKAKRCACAACYTSAACFCCTERSSLRFVPVSCGLNHVRTSLRVRACKFRRSWVGACRTGHGQADHSKQHTVE